MNLLLSLCTILACTVWPSLAKVEHRLPIGPTELPSEKLTLEAPQLQAVAWKQGGRIWVEYVYFSATLGGRQLTLNLLGRDHQDVIRELGMSCNTPYELTVLIEQYTFDRRGRLLRGPEFIGPMSKEEFDLRPEAEPLVPVPKLLPSASLYLVPPAPR